MDDYVRNILEKVTLDSGDTIKIETFVFDGDFFPFLKKELKKINYSIKNMDVKARGNDLCITVKKVDPDIEKKKDEHVNSILEQVKNSGEDIITITTHSPKEYDIFSELSKIRTINYSIIETVSDGDTYNMKFSKVERIKSDLYRLRVGGLIVQFGPTKESLTLLKYPELMDRTSFHKWFLIDNNSNEYNIKTCEAQKSDTYFIFGLPYKDVDYFDGEKNNVFFMMHGMGASRLGVSVNDDNMWVNMCWRG